jgi:hypothetical protein
MRDVPEYLRSPTTGEIERPIESSAWMLPSEVWNDRRYVYWRASLVDGLPEHLVSGGRGMLASFLNLETAPAEKIVRFIKRWGPLGLRRRIFSGGAANKELDRYYGTPKHWRSDAYPSSLLTPVITTIRFADKSRSAIASEEPLHIWRYWARKFAAAIRISEAVRTGEVLPEAWRTDWGQFVHGSRTFLRLRGRTPVGKNGKPVPLGTATKYLGTDIASVLAEWMRIADLTLSFTYCEDSVGHDSETLTNALSDARRVTTGPSGFRLSIETQHAFAGLVLQLMAAMSGVAGFAVCSTCGSIYAPMRQPHLGELNYCRKCRRRARTLAMRRHRQRQKTISEKNEQEGKRNVKTR